MVVYVAVALLPALLLPLKKNNNKNTYLFCVLFVLFWISTFRAGYIGTDYRGYVEVFYRAVGFYNQHEFGFSYLMKIAYLCGQHYVFFAFFVNILIFIPLFLYLRKYVGNMHIFYCVFVFTVNPYFYINMSFNTLRQACAMGVLLFSVKYLYEKKWCSFFFIVLISATFHKSSYAAFLLIIFRLINWTKLKLIGACFFSFVIHIFMGNVNFMLKLVELLKYDMYADSRAKAFDSLLYLSFILVIIILLVYLYKSLYTNTLEKFFIDLYIVSLIILIILVKNTNAYRVYTIVSFMALPAIAIIMKNLKNKSKLLFKFASCVLIMYYFMFYSAYFYKLIVEKDICYIPFKFFWQVQ